MEPNEQGNLDALCGIYSIINAIQKISNKDIKDKLFSKIINFLDIEKNRLRDTLIKGTNKATMLKIMDATTSNFISFHMPFKQNHNVELTQFWNEAVDFLKEEDRAIIVNLGGKDWRHWTVVESISEHQLRFYDSVLLKRMNRQFCTTQKATKTRPHSLRPTRVIFIKKNV